MEKWWLGLVKLFSLTSGITSFLLICLFYIDHQSDTSNVPFLQYCSFEIMMIIIAILIITAVVYFLIMKSQMSLRYKEFFVRRLYGETSIGIAGILVFETLIYVMAALVWSLVLIDQIAPLFNTITQKSIDTRALQSYPAFVVTAIYLVLLVVLTTFLPARICAGKSAIDFLRKISSVGSTDK